MKKTIQKEVEYCDKCQNEAAYEACLGCGVQLCYECRKRHGVSYAHGVYFCGSGDGFYCKACDNGFTVSGKNKKHNAYRAIKSLKDEVEAWSIDFRRRQEKSEKELKSIE